MGWTEHIMGYMHYGWGDGLMIILWIVLITFLIFFLMRARQKNSFSSGTTESALDILKKRYARGEITKMEFEERKKDLV